MAGKIKARARIRIPFGPLLTKLVQLPANAERALVAPCADKPSKLTCLLLALALLLLAIWRLRMA